MDKMGITKSETHKIGNADYSLHTKMNEKYNYKLLMAANTLKRNMFVYDEQFKYYDQYINQSLDILFINFQGLHLTHLLPDRKFEKFAIETIINLEKHFDKVIEIMAMRNAKC